MVEDPLPAPVKGPQKLVAPMEPRQPLLQYKETNGEGLKAGNFQKGQDNRTRREENVLGFKLSSLPI